jgi:hypothetical protein
VRRLLAGLLGAVGLAGLVAYLRRRREPVAAPEAHAEELRRTLEESRAAADQIEEQPAAPEELDAGELDARRREVHDRGRSALEDMGPATSD